MTSNTSGTKSLNIDTDDDLDINLTVEAIRDVQLKNGLIPWFPGGHSDPWNHIEAAMALDAGALYENAELAYQWLADAQLPDGSWCAYYLTCGVEDPRKDTNMSAYIATGVWHHFLCTNDTGFLEQMWPTLKAAVDFVCSHQRAEGGFTWSIEPDGTPGRFSLLTGSSSIYFSLLCANAAAKQLGFESENWELAAKRVSYAINKLAGTFEPKPQFAMDWYYPILSHALDTASSFVKMWEGWWEFVIRGWGVRCVSDKPWVTTAETAECAMALDIMGLSSLAEKLLSWTKDSRCDDGSYLTGRVYPEGTSFPGQERTTYSSAAVVLAAKVLEGSTATATLFKRFFAD
ncbi:MAG: prenyltransferase [Actinobacteria bacterium]|nr:prenyltransferase [Actinomycetota bacterium]MCL6104605.1 prenyltransferase [Actinomycetota bacterium]